MKHTIACLLVALLFYTSETSLGEVFGTGANTFEIEFVEVGSYEIAKFELPEDAINKANIGQLRYHPR
ncbi:hypothetical protein [Aeoliella sp.]|uniref:hypothetical protein n=1 Tax=Aeoliella sp. TaxID=2795800 RepID=UPI003CCBBCC9